jgi:hypothetical protein
VTAGEAEGFEVEHLEGSTGQARVADDEEVVGPRKARGRGVRADVAGVDEEAEQQDQKQVRAREDHVARLSVWAGQRKGRGLVRLPLLPTVTSSMEGFVGFVCFVVQGSEAPGPRKARRATNRPTQRRQERKSGCLLQR